MAYYFFTDIDHLFNQSQNGEFGSITDFGTNSEKFQITSKQNCQINSKAYAITDGLIMIQPNESNSNLVNIVLKPTKQAIDVIAIDYFIYRGVKKDSIFNGTLVKSSGNDLCIQVNNTITKLNQKYPLNTHIPEEYILSYGAVADNDFVLNILPLGGLVENVTLNQAFNTRNLLYKPFKISGGSYIGDYNSEFGIDIVLKKANSKISDARKSDNFIISTKQIGLSGEDLLLNKAEKEKSLNYFDIYQFYAFTYENASIEVKNSSESVFTKIRIKNDPQNKFVTIKNHFNNGDWVFIDIRNQFNNSLNFENNIAANIAVKLGDNATYVNNYNYPVWPLLKFQIGGLNSIYIKIPKSDFTTARAYFRESNKDTYVFKAINFDTSNYSTEFKIKLPKSQNGITIGCYFYFMFLREIDDNLDPSEWVVKPNHFVDTIFDVEDLIYTDDLGNIKIKGIETFSKPTKWNIFDDNTFVFKNERSFMAKKAIAEDADNLYLFAFSNGESPQISSFDLPIVAGESESPKFLENVLLPKFNNALTFYSYELEYNSEAVYVLKDNINGAILGSNIKLSPNKNNFVLIAIDKAENLVKLKNAYLAFSNDLPKRMVLKNRQHITSANGKKYWEATVFLSGYGNNTVTNSYEVKEVDTTIKLIYEKQDQCFLGTNIFNQTYLKDELEINGLNYYGVIFKNFSFGLREEPFTYNTVNQLGKTGLHNIHFKLLGKCFIDPQTFTGNTQSGLWYYIELSEDVDDSQYFQDTNGHHQYIPKGTRCFIHNSASPYIYAKYDCFIEDFIELNEQYDIQPVAQNDSFEDRIIRIRQRTHKSDVWAFNIITSGYWPLINDVSDTVNLDEIPYENGTNVPFNTSHGVVSINLKIQFLADYSGIEFYNGKVADMQHLMVGLEVINNKMDMLLATYGIVVNVNIALYCGDAGTVPAGIINLLDGDDVTAKEFIDNINLIRLNSSTGPTFNVPIEMQYYQHFQNKQFPIYDMIGNIYSFGLNGIRNKMIYVVNSEIIDNTTISPSQRIIDIFETFNLFIDIYDEESIFEFYKTFNLDYNFSISSQGTNSSYYDNIIDDTIDFAKIWYFEKINLLSGNPFAYLTPEQSEKVEYYSKLSISEFVDVLNEIYYKYKK